MTDEEKGQKPQSSTDPSADLFQKRISCVYGGCNNGINESDN